MANQSYSLQTIRNAAILTNSYVASTVIGQTNIQAQENNQLLLYIDFTIGSLTTAEIKTEYSDDGINYYQDSSISVTSGIATVSGLEYQFDATGSYVLSIPMKAKYVRVSAKGTGTVTSSSMAIKSIIATA